MPTVFIGEASRRWAHNVDDLRDRWQIRHEPPTDQEWMPVVYFKQTVRVLSDEALLDMRADLTEVQHDIMGQLGNIKGLWRGRGIPTERAVYEEVQAARRSVGRHLLVIGDELSVRRHKVHEERQAEFRQRFIETVKTHVDRQTFLAWVAEAGGQGGRSGDEA